ncbi:MAG: hypothetical protein NTW14_13735 [bacterium]|nr:hypothetical protein [bacterium]
MGSVKGKIKIMCTSVLAIGVLLSLCILSERQSLAADGKKLSSTNSGTIRLSGTVATMKMPLNPYGKGYDPRVIDSGVPIDSVIMEFTLNWTDYSIHRADNYGDIQIILPGSVFSTDPLTWRLTALNSTREGPPHLFFIENILGQSGPASGTDIPLSWEISINGGAFNPMTLLPDNTLTTTFPAGPHTFQVRITGTPQYHQADGYYRLQLTQSLVPQL